MAKMLGQDIFTQAEFDEFKANDFDKLAKAQKDTHNAIGDLLTAANQAKHRANLALVCGAAALVVSLIALFA